ncbi:MAG: FHA domain-containing protein [Planctomycetota bacterium]|nr:FHA domain-containing protein [Planctomycetota bacterium]
MEVKLVVFKSTGQRKVINVTEPTTVVGRGEECEIHVPVGSVSRRHSELTIKGKDLLIKDLASSNGTYVNGARVTQAKLKAGDRVSIGPIVFTVQIDGQPSEIRPVKARPAQASEAAQQARTDDEIIDLATAPAHDDDAMAALASAAKDDSDILPAQSGDSGMGIPLDDDPISALEALSADVKKKKKKPGR